MTGPDLAPEAVRTDEARPPGRWRRVALAAAVLLLLGLGAAAQLVMTRLVRSLGRADQSHGVLAVVTNVEASLRSAESAHRGWMATGEESFRPEFEAAVATLEGSLRELARLTAEDVGQQQRLDVLRKDVAARVAFWRAQQALAASGAAGREAAAAATVEGLAQRTSIGRQLRSVQATERDLLERRQRQVRRALSAARLMSGAAVLASVALALVAVYALRRNVHVRQVVERELADTEGEIRTILDSVHDLTESSSAAGRILHVNRAWLDTLGWSESEVVGQPWESFIAPEVRGPGRALFARLVTSHEPIAVDTVLLRKDGGRVHVRGTSVMRHEAGLPVATRTVLRNVTRERELERRRQELAAVVGHELRTPLVSVRGVLAQLASGQLGPVTEAAHRMARAALADADRLIERSEELLDTERARLVPCLARSPADLADVANQAEEVMRPLAVQAGVLVKVSVLPDTRIVCDRDSILQLLATLLANAIGYSPGGAAVLLNAVQTEEHVHVRVIDHGPPVPAAELEYLFSREHQAAEPNFDDRGRAGLALDVCRAIVEQHGGLIWAQSEAHGRTTVHAVLPNAPAAAASPPADATGAAEAPPQARRVLLVDADDEVRALARASLELTRGWEIFEATSGQDGVRLAAELRPDAVLVAPTLRDMDAIATLHALHEHAETRDIPVILLTHGTLPLPDKKALRRDTGMRDAITTPFDPLALGDEISRILAWDPDLFPDWG